MMSINEALIVSQCLTMAILRFLSTFILILASLAWIVFDLQSPNDWISQTFFKELTNGINKLSNLDKKYKHRTVSEHEDRKSYYALLKVIKRNAKNKNIDYEKAREIESKSLLLYAVTPDTEKTTQVIPPLITLRNSNHDLKDDQPLASLNDLKTWIQVYEKDEFFKRVFLGLFLGFLLQFIEASVPIIKWVDNYMGGK